MPFEPGKSGNPSGRQKLKPWREALDRALAQFELKDETGEVKVKAGEALRAIADRVVMLALAGDKDAYKEIANRLDGTADQNVNLGVDIAGAEGLSIFTAFLLEAAARPAVTDAQAVDTGGLVLPAEIRPTTQ